MPQAIDRLFIDELIAATRDVFTTMVFHDVQPLSPVEGDTPQSVAQVVGTVAFAGKTSGLVAFASTRDTAQLITASMLGIEPASVSNELPDAIGELTNLIAGLFRTRMARVTGETWAISVPTVTMGLDFPTRQMSQAQRVLCPFHMKGVEVAEVFVALVVTRRAP